MFSFVLVFYWHVINYQYFGILNNTIIISVSGGQKSRYRLAGLSIHKAEVKTLTGLHSFLGLRVLYQDHGTVCRIQYLTVVGLRSLLLIGHQLGAALGARVTYCSYHKAPFRNTYFSLLKSKKLPQLESSSEFQRRVMSSLPTELFAGIHLNWQMCTHTPGRILRYTKHRLRIRSKWLAKGNPEEMLHKWFKLLWGFYSLSESTHLSIYRYYTFSPNKHLFPYLLSLWNFFSAKPKGQGLVIDHWSSG